MDDPWQAQFPRLVRDRFIDYAGVRIKYTTDPSPDDLVARLHLAALTPDGRVVVCLSTLGWNFLPGGTREPEESLRDLAARQLAHEAGATLLGEPRLFAAHIAESDRDQPFRPHIPHPRAHWAYAVADVELSGPPTPESDGGTVAQVNTFEPLAAADHLEEHDALQADVLRHAHHLGLLSR